MLRHHVQNGITRSWQQVDFLGLGETISTPAPLEVNEEFRDAALNPVTQYSDLYETGMRLSHYNFMLTDYSFFQFSWSAEDQVRYAYYPNPYFSGDNEIVAKVGRWRKLIAEESITHEDFLELVGSVRAAPRVPLIRYENAPDQYRAFRHPCSHLHIGHHSDNRWPVARVVTPLAFTFLILKQYYGPTWRVLNDEEEQNGNPLDTNFIAERAECRVLGEEHFCAAEKTAFYLA